MSSPDGTPKAKILVLEDREEVRQVICDTLEMRGYEVYEASTPSAALRIAKEQTTLNALITDIVMPEMNGRELAQRVRQTHPGIGIIYMSGYPTEVLTSTTASDARTVFLAKPFRLNELVEKLQELLA